VASSPRPLSPPEIEERLRARFGSDVLAFEDQFGHAVATVSLAKYHDAMAFLRSDPSMGFDYFDFLGGVDYGDDGIEIVSHLVSIKHGHQVRVKTRCGKEPDERHVPTLSDLWAGANWHEREAAEMFDVTFDGHPQPVKLLLAEEFEGHPLRKDFALMSREAKPWPGATEEEDE
jgi:NADH-quinone oxidoreductase subunit C